MPDEVNSVYVLAKPDPYVTEIHFIRKREEAVVPEIATAGAAAWDLTACMPDQSIITGYTPSNDKVIFTPVSDIGTNKPPYGITIPPGHRMLIPTGLAVAVPPRFWMGVHSRSGTALKGGLVVGNGVGVIDSDYRGEVFVILSNTSQQSIRIQHGDRIAQAMIHESHVSHAKFVEVEELPATERGEGGFGSTNEVKQ